MTDTIIAKPAFRSKLIVDAFKGFPYELIEPLIYDSAVLGQTVVVPSGFLTDFASIPWFFHRILPKDGPYNPAAVIHDRLYARGSVTAYGPTITRAQADAVLNEAMEVCQVATWRRWLIYRAVRLGGQHAWNEYRAGRHPNGIV